MKENSPADEFDRQTAVPPFTCGHVPEGVCDKCLDERIEARMASSVTETFYLSNYHTGEIIEIKPGQADWVVDEIEAIGGYVRFSNFQDASDYCSGRLRSFLLMVLIDCVEGR